MFTVFEPKKRKLMGNTPINICEGPTSRDDSSKSKEISAFSKALMRLNAQSQNVSTLVRSTANKVITTRSLRKYFKKIFVDRKLFQSSITTFLDTVAIESNFDLRNLLFAHRTAQMDPEKTYLASNLLFEVENEVYQHPQWIFPSLVNTLIFKDMESTASINLRKHIHRNEYWPMVDLELSGTDRSSQVLSSVNRIKVTVQQWQEAFFAAFDSFINETRETFQVLGDTGVSIQSNSSSGATKATVSSLYLSVSFLHTRDKQPCCIIVGANKPFLRRLFALGAEPYIISDSTANSASSSSSGKRDLSAAGRLDRLKIGQNLLLNGKFNLSVVVNCILEQVIFPGLGSLSSMLLDSLPVIRSAKYFCHAVPEFLTPRAVHSNHNASTANTATDTISADQRRVVLVGDAPVSVLSDLVNILMKFASAPEASSLVHHESKPPSSLLAYPNMKLQVQAMLLGTGAGTTAGAVQQRAASAGSASSSSSSSTATATAAASNENYNPMALLTLKSSASGSTSEGKKVGTPTVHKKSVSKSTRDNSLSVEDEETLSTEDWLGRVRSLNLRYFILRPTYKNHRVLGLLGYTPSVHHSGVGVEQVEVILEGDEVIQEIRWHSETPSLSAECVYIRSHPAPTHTTRRAIPSDAQQFYTTTLNDPDPTTAIPPSTQQRGSVDEQQRLSEEGIILQPLNAYSEFVETRIV